MEQPGCIFCQIAVGRAPAAMVYQDEQIMAFRDIHPQAPVHILVVPRVHIPSLAEVSEEHTPLLGAVVRAAQGIAAQEGVAPSGYRLVVNVGRGAGQTIFHLHWHLIGGWGRGAPTGRERL